MNISYLANPRYMTLHHRSCNIQDNTYLLNNRTLMDEKEPLIRTRKLKTIEWTFIPFSHEILDLRANTGAEYSVSISICFHEYPHS
jgi:hypothetical protein